MNRRSQSGREPRRGAAFLILVVLVLLVVVDATRTLVRSEVSSRQYERGQARLRSMRAAINAASQTPLESNTPIRFPVDQRSEEHIEVTAAEDGLRITARWLKGDQEIDKMTQTIGIQAEKTE